MGFRICCKTTVCRGWLYWRKGLESAIIAHFSADIILHVVAPAGMLVAGVPS